MQNPHGELMHLSLVPHTHIDQAWADGAFKLADACDESGGEITADQLKLMLSRGERMLFAGVHLGKPIGWIVIRVDQLPNLRALHICELYAPGALFDDFFEQLNDLAKQHGCSEIRCSAKPAQARLYRMRFGFEPVYETLKVRTRP